MRFKRFLSVLLTAAIFMSALVCGTVPASAAAKEYAVEGYYDYVSGDYCVSISGVPVDALFGLVMIHIKFSKSEIVFSMMEMGDSFEAFAIKNGDAMDDLKITGGIYESANSEKKAIFSIPKGSKYIDKIISESKAQVLVETWYALDGKNISTYSFTPDGGLLAGEVLYDVKPSWSSVKPYNKNDADSTEKTKDKPSSSMGVKVTKTAQGKAKISWSKVNEADGYVVYMATSKNGTYSKLKTLTKNTKVSIIKSNLKAGKTYYFKVRAYKTVDGKKIYSEYSLLKSIKM